MLLYTLRRNLVEMNVSLVADQDRHPLQLRIGWYPPKALQFWSLPLSLCWCEKVNVLNLYQFSSCCVNLCVLILIFYLPGIAFSYDKPLPRFSSHVVMNQNLSYHINRCGCGVCIFVFCFFLLFPYDLFSLVFCLCTAAAPSCCIYWSYLNNVLYFHG